MTEIFAPYKWEALFARWPDILAAFGMTAAISALALVIALVLGFVFGVFAVSRFRILRALTRVYVETVQNIPLLLQVFVLYAVFPLIGLTIASFWIGVIAVGCVVPLVCALVGRRKNASTAALATIGLVCAIVGAVCLRMVFYSAGASVFMFF